MVFQETLQEEVFNNIDSSSIGEDGIIDLEDIPQLHGVGTCLDNCVASLTFICGYQSNQLPSNQIHFLWSQIVSCLPLVEEEEESVRVTRLLVKLYDQDYWKQALGDENERMEIEMEVQRVLIEGTFSTPFLISSKTILEEVLALFSNKEVSEEYAELLNELNEALVSLEDGHNHTSTFNTNHQEITEIYLNNHY